MPSPYYSVIIPAYNRAVPLKAAIKSVLGQTFQDFEIIVVDDGSRDDPRTVVEAFADPRIRFIAQDNQGGGAARNAAIDMARGRYIAPLDSDDIFLPHHLQAMKELLEENPGATGYARILVDRGKGRSFLKPPRAIGEDEDMGEYLLCRRGFVPTITLVVEREMAKKVRYPTDLRTAEDTDFAIRLALAGCKFKMAPKPGAVWRDLPDPARTSANLTSRSLRAQRYAAWLDKMKPLLTRRAWHGTRGWYYARMLARDRRKLEALRLYLTALLRGCYAPRMAGVIFLQVFLDAGTYRAIADHAIAWLHMGLREEPETPSRAKLKQI